MLLHGVAFLSWNQHPGPKGSRRATPLLPFQHSSGQPLPPRSIWQRRNPRLRPLHLVVRETEFCGLRLAGYFRRRMRENKSEFGSQTTLRLTNPPEYGGFCLPGNRPGLSGLHGGGCRNRTDGHRSLASLQNEAACRGFSARNDLSQRMSKSLAGKPKALTINRYLPVSLRVHSLSSRSRAMVVTCSRALRRLQE